MGQAADKSNFLAGVGAVALSGHKVGQLAAVAGQAVGNFRADADDPVSQGR
ncbi:hypothetical protein [Aliamphritea spongicola]|nr:hypothetical protein [Aliamphritea spongicola]